MKHLKSLLLIIFLMIIFQPKIAFAHVLKTDGSIGAIFHTDPDDDPIAGSPTIFFFDFKDKNNKFNPVNCNCDVSITENGKEIYSQSLFQNNPNPSLDNINFSYVFPDINTYQVIVTGKPKIDNAFQSFSLTYDVEVNKTSIPTNASTNPTNSVEISTNTTAPISKYLSIILAVLILGFILFIFLNKRTSSKP